MNGASETGNMHKASSQVMNGIENQGEWLDKEADSLRDI